MFEKLRTHRLFWVLIGVTLSAVTQVTFETLVQRQPIMAPDKPRNTDSDDFSNLPPHREKQPLLSRKQSEWLVVRSDDMSKERQTEVIASVGACLGRFEVENLSHGYEIRIPTKKLSQSDYECILRETTKVSELVKMRDLGDPELENIVIRPEIWIHYDR